MPDPRAPLRRLILTAGVLVLALVSPLLVLQWFPIDADLPGTVTQRPLRPAKTAAGPRFVAISAEQSGLTFANVLEEHNRYQYLTNGSGLAVGDYDNDGWPDVYLVSLDGPNKLFRQTAPLVFEDVTIASGGLGGGEAWGAGASFTDVDNDGLLDLYVCNLEAKNLLYRNLGDGRFVECAAEFGLDIAAASTMAAFCDFDRDGDLDLYLLTNRSLHPQWVQTPEVLDGIRAPADSVRPPSAMTATLDQLRDPVLRRLQQGAPRPGDQVPEALAEHFMYSNGLLHAAGQPDRLLRNDGGSFVDVTASAGIADQGMGLSASWCDYDRDGWPDLYVANDLESPDVLWRNLGDGTFRDVTDESLPHTAYFGMGSDWGDFDNDGNIDLFVADMSATTHRMSKILMGDMSTQRTFLIRSRPQQYMRNALLHNTGTERFQEVAYLAGVASTDWTWSCLFGDLDSDGRQDLFCTNGIARFDMNPDITIRVRELYAQERYQDMVRVIQTIPAVPERNIALRNEGDLKFLAQGADWGLDFEGVSHGAALVDLDRDGDLDVLTNNFNAPVGLWENRTPSPNALAVELHGLESNRHGIGARLELTTGSVTQTRENWLSRGYLSGQEPRVVFGLGEHERADRLVIRWPSGILQQLEDVAAGQLLRVREPRGSAEPSIAGEPQPKAVLRPRSLPAVAHREQPFDDYGDQPLLPHKLSQLGPGIAIGDFDGDGFDDAFLGGAAGQAGTLVERGATVWAGQADAPWTADAACEDMGVLWFDHDGDGDLDLYVVSGGVEHPAGDARLQDRLYRNDGGSFTRTTEVLPDLRFSGSCCSAADFDLDGDLDLFIGGRTVPGEYPDAPASRLLQNDDGRFRDVTETVAPALLQAGMVSGATFSDANGDGWPDLMIAGRWQPLRWLRNDQGRFTDATQAAGLARHHGWWNSVVSLDVDGDGDADFVAGNQGYNSKYKASPERPLTLFFADFDGNGTRDLIESKYEGARLLPVRGRSCSSSAMPFLERKFPTYEKFASAALAEIYPEPQLAAAGQLSASCLESVLLRNDGAGQFAVEPLPRAAQIAPLFGLAVADYDGDGHLDVAAATNFFSPEPETGRFDGAIGLLLRGDGTNLIAVPPRESGLTLSGDQKGAAVAYFDNDGATDLVLARNDAPLAGFRTAARTRSLSLRLQGPPGNPTGVGAVVVVADASGRQRRIEQLAGSGYLSQSSATMRFSRTESPVTSVTVRWPDRTTTRLTEGLDRGLLVARWR